MQEKCFAANVAPPGNPTTIFALVSAALDHLESSLRSADQVVSLITQSGEAKKRLEVLVNSSTDLNQPSTEFTTDVASESRAQAIKAETWGKLFPVETSLVTLYCDVELRVTSFSVLNNEISSLLADVQRLSGQFPNVRWTVARLQGSLLLHISSLGEARAKDFEETKF